MSITPTPAHHIDFFSRLLWGLDWLPFISTGKWITDIFATRHWHPAQPDTLSFYAKTYHQHLLGKEHARHVAAVPIFGNIIVIVQDCYIYAQKNKSAAHSSHTTPHTAHPKSNLKAYFERIFTKKPPSIESYFKKALSTDLSDSLAAQNALFNIACGEESPERTEVCAWLLENMDKLKHYSTEFYNWRTIPTALRAKHREIITERLLTAKEQRCALGESSTYYTIQCDFWEMYDREDAEGRSEIIAALQKAGDTGNLNAYGTLVGDIALSLLERKILGSHQHMIFEWNSHKELILQWFIRHVENPSSPLAKHAWKKLVGYIFYNENALLNAKVLSACLQMIKRNELSKEKREDLILYLEYLAEHGTQSQRSQIFAAFLKQGEEGDCESMHWVGCQYLKQGDVNAALIWLKKAAERDFVPSICALGDYFDSINDIDRAIFWYEKAASRNSHAALCLEYLKIKRRYQSGYSYFHSFHFHFTGRRSDRQNTRSDHAKTNNTHDRAHAKDRPRQDDFRAKQAEYEKQRKEQEQAKAKAEQEARQRAERERAKAQEAHKAAQPKGPEAELQEIIGPFTTSSEMRKAYHKWALKGHPDKGGNTATFQQVGNLLEAVKKRKGWE